MNANMASKVMEMGLSKKNEDKVIERKKANDKARVNFAKKFGHLKKASVLIHHGRANDAFDEIAKAADIIKQEAEIKREYETSL